MPVETQRGVCRMNRWCFYFMVLLATFFTCCGDAGRRAAVQVMPYAPPGQLVDESAQVGLYLYRRANFSGGGRIHLLQLDDRTLGPLTDANYYHLYLWPGRYYLNVHLPAEDFLGQVKPAMNKSFRLVLPSRFAGQTLVYEYKDGENFRRLDKEAVDIASVTKRRSLAKYLEVDETAQVTRFLDTRYDGPSLYGKPHGRGILTWEDGSRYEGVFNYGQLTAEGKFYFADGRMYMGQLAKGRPKGRGVLISPDGRVLYAGFFVDEVPHGRGIRRGPRGPEYCTFEHGVDITTPIRQLADEAVAAEEQALEALIRTQAEAAVVETPDGPVSPEPATNETLDDIPENTGNHALEAVKTEPVTPPEEKQAPAGGESPASALPEILQEGSPIDGSADTVEKADASLESEAGEAEPDSGDETEAPPEAEKKPDYQQQLDRLRRNWQWRIIVMRKTIAAEHQASLDQEKSWCDDELIDGRDWCICAPFDPDAGRWKSCMR